MNAPLFFESAGDERGTPQDFFDKLNAEFHFDLDAAASSRNHKCELYYGEGGIVDNALETDWGGPGFSVFLNPPYSVAGAFVAKAREEADKGATVVMLLPVRSDTKWWQNFVWDHSAWGPFQALIESHERVDGNFRPGVRVRFLPGRLNFELTVPKDVRAWIKSELATVKHTIIHTQHGSVPKYSAEDWKEKVKSLVEATGLPKMAIERIDDDQPDDCLMDAAPFPSCVVIFTKA